jgi:ribosome maturation protein Sdo1
MSDQPTTSQTTTLEKRRAELSPDEKEIITAVEKDHQRPLTVQEIDWALEQARQVGML